MALTREQLQQELKRRFDAAIALTKEEEIDFELFVRIADYVRLIENTPFLLLLVEADRGKWNEKNDKLESITGFFANLKRQVQRRDLSDFHFSRGYSRLLRVYHVVNYLNEETPPPANFEWENGFEKAVDDLQNIRFNLALVPSLFSRNSFQHPNDHYGFWLEKTYFALASALSMPERRKGLEFDLDKSLLLIGDKTVRIQLKSDPPNSHYVLDYIFEHGKTERAYFSDIIDAKFPKERMDWRSIYRACQDIQDKVKKQAELSDFLIMTTGKSGHVAINPLYA